jgi:flagellum-specific peptidoglycan hydrolase FlgJ
VLATLKLKSNLIVLNKVFKYNEVFDAFMCTNMMKKTSNFTALVIFLFPVLMLLSGRIKGQQELNPRYSQNSTPKGNVEDISVRIATLYNADAASVQLYVQAAVDLESSTGIAAVVVVAIAIHESSFNSVIFSNSGNPFGIKASKPWTGATYSKWHDGSETKFRSYNSPEEAVADFGYFINSRPWYADALTCPNQDYRCILNGLKKTNLEIGYSLNPNWDEAVLNIIEKIGLKELERPQR